MKSYFAFATHLLFFLQAGVCQTSSQKVEWLTIEQAVQKSNVEPRKFFIDVYTDWCGWCRKMDAATFENPVIASYLNEKYYAVKLNAEVRDSIFFKGKFYVFVPNGSRGYHALANELMEGRMSFPTVVFLDERLNRIQAIPGFREAEEMDRILKYFGENYYRTTEYGNFHKNYVSPFLEAAPIPGN